MDVGEGVYICPTQQELLQVTSPNHKALLTNFHQACLQIKRVLDQAAKSQVGWANMIPIYLLFTLATERT